MSEHHRLLIVEDVQNIADMVCTAASDVGFNACSANGASAAVMYDNFHPHVVVLDLLVSGLAEFEFIQFLQERQSTAKIVILSGSSSNYRQMAESIAKAGRLKVEASMGKPFRLSELRDTLKAIKMSLAEPVRSYQHIA